MAKPEVGTRLIEEDVSVVLTLGAKRDFWQEILTPNEADKLALELIRFAQKARAEELELKTP